MVFNNFSKYDIDLEKGTIYSNAFNKKRMLTLSETADGYIRCGVTDDKGNRYYRLHQVIYCAANGVTKDDFPKDENGYKYEIDHIDNNKKNNLPSNLRLVSKKEQMNNELTLQTLSEASFKRMEDKSARDNIAKKLLNRKDESKRVCQIDKESNEVIAIYPSIMEACRQTKINFTHISSCCKGDRELSGGFKWRFALT